jgi:hypothetical protein
LRISAQSFRFERVDTVTIRVFLPDETRRGTTVGWALDVGHRGRDWWCRCHDVAAGPFAQDEAKRVTVLLAQGGYFEPVTRVPDPIAWLNRAAALARGREAPATTQNEALPDD